MNTPTGKKNDLIEVRYRNAPQVAKIMGVEPHTIRFWVKQFGLNIRCASNRMYIDEAAFTQLLHIYQLRYIRKFTIEGAKLEMQSFGSEK